MEKEKSSKAVTEILGTILLLAMAIALFSVVNIMVFSYPFPDIAPSVSIVATIEDNKIIIEHHGGDYLDNYRVIIRELDGNLILSDDYNTRWGIGEKIIYTDNVPAGKKVEVIVVDIESNTVIMRSSLE